MRILLAAISILFFACGGNTSQSLTQEKDIEPEKEVIITASSDTVIEFSIWDISLEGTSAKCFYRKGNLDSVHFGIYGETYQQQVYYKIRDSFFEVDEKHYGYKQGYLYAEGDNPRILEDSFSYYMDFDGNPINLDSGHEYFPLTFFALQTSVPTRIYRTEIANYDSLLKSFADAWPDNMSADIFADTVWGDCFTMAICKTPDQAGHLNGKPYVLKSQIKNNPKALNKFFSFDVKEAIWAKIKDIQPSEFEKGNIEVFYKYPNELKGKNDGGAVRIFFKMVNKTVLIHTIACVG